MIPPSLQNNILMKETKTLAEVLLQKLDTVSPLLSLIVIVALSTLLWTHARFYWCLNSSLDETTVKNSLSLFGAMMVFMWFSYRWICRNSFHQFARLSLLAQLTLAPGLLICGGDDSYCELLCRGLMVGAFDRMTHQRFVVSAVFFSVAIYLQSALITYIPVALPMTLSYIFGPAVFWELHVRNLVSFLITWGLITVIWWFYGSGAQQYTNFVQLVMTDYKFFKNYHNWGPTDIPAVIKKLSATKKQITLVLAPIPALFSTIPCGIVSFTGKPEVLLWSLSNCAQLFHFLSFGAYKIPPYLIILPTLVAATQSGQPNANVSSMVMWFHNLVIISKLPQAFLNSAFNGFSLLVFIIGYNCLFTKRGAVLPKHRLTKTAVLLSYVAMSGVLFFKLCGFISFTKWQDLHTAICERGLSFYVSWQFLHMFAQTSIRPQSS